MPLDPAAKIAAQARAAEKRKAKRRNANIAKSKPRHRSHLSQSEKIIIGELVAEGTPAQIEAAAVLMRRPVERVRSAVSSAKQKFQASADKYVEIHSKVAEMALATGDYAEARKAAEFAMTNLSARDSEGNVETIIDRDAAANSGPRIQIGIALGGLPVARNSSD